jgi:phage terminase large subunit-like protein
MKTAKKPVKSMSSSVSPEALTLDPALFADTFLPHNEKGQPWTLSRHQRRVLDRAFRRGLNGELLFQILLWSEPKKSGKTFLAAVLLLWWAFTHANTEIIVAANDLEQSVSRVFQTAVALLTHNAAVAGHVTVRAEKLFFANGTIVTAIASDYRGAAGSRHSLVIFDELWGYHSENLTRLYEELTPPPTEEDAWVLVVTYAGFIGESALLEQMYQRGLAGSRTDDELELYEADGLFMFWSHTGRMPWQRGPEGERYYAAQQRSLQATTFARLHRNEWVTAESTFITVDLWDPCVDPDHRPLLPNRRLQVAVGVDAATKHDQASVQVVARDGDWIVHVTGRSWQPSPADPLDLESTVEQYLWELLQGYAVTAILVDPFQMHRSITTLAKLGAPIVEFPQTVANTTRMGQILFDLLKGRNLVLYPDPELREQALNTVGIETSRGVRIGKERASRKIDAIVALAIACCAALDHPESAPLPTPEEEAEELANLRAFQRSMGWAPVPLGGWDNYVADEEAGWLSNPHEGPIDIGR